MNTYFDIDPFPGKPKILFVGHAASSHAHGWIDLLSADFNVRLFGLPSGYPPPDWQVRTYLTSPYLPEGLDPCTRQWFHPRPEDLQRQQKGRITFPFESPAASYELWLAQIIERWRPHVIHTLGLDPAAFFYRKVRNSSPSPFPLTWVAQVRGGSDLALTRHNPEQSGPIGAILKECDQIITDNRKNFEYLLELGAQKEQIASVAPVPGSGGVPVEKLSQLLQESPSRRRMILWPKAYESNWAKALPVFEALKLAWNRIQPCEIVMLWAIPETKAWFLTLPQEMRKACRLFERIPREQVFEFMRQARIMLSPSLVDGIPNTLYEAMACGSFPIVSPLDTICPVVEDETHVLFARNLYPDEIAKALVRAMNDDALVDEAAQRNLAVVKRLADREVIGPRLCAYYHRLCKQVDETRQRPLPERDTGKGELPLVTIITPAYNRADFLHETVRSVLTQDYPHIEYIILDDGSTDETPEVLEEYGSLIHCERHANMGETRTVNKGFSMAKGEIVCVVNSDDPLLPGAVREAVNVLRTHPEALAAYPDWLEVDSNSQPISEVRLPDFDLLSMLTSFNVGMGPGTFIRKSAFDLAGFRDTQFRYAGDLEFWFRLALNGRLIHIPKILATHRTHGDSASVSAKGARMSGELIRMTKKITDDPRAPGEIGRERRKFLSKAHSAAVSYCGADRIAALKHRIAAFYYDPGRYVRHFVGQFVRYLTAAVFRTARRLVLLIASGVLPRLRAPLFLFLKIENGIGGALRGRSKTKPETGMKRRFCLVSHVLPPSWSGQAVVIRRLLAEVDPAGYCLVSLNDYAGESSDRFIEGLGGTYHRVHDDLPDMTSMKGRRKLLTLLYAAFLRGWRIARIANEEGCSALLGASGNIIDLPAAYLASRLLGIPFFPYLFDDYVYQWQDPAFRSFAGTFASLIFPNSKSVIVPNEFLAKEIRRQYKATTTIIRNPCETDEPDGNISWSDRGSPHVPVRSHSQEGMSIVYTGAIYHVNFGAFRNLIAAMDDPGLSGLTLHLYSAQPREYLAREGIAGTRIEYHEHVPPTEVAEAQACAHILFVPFAFDSPVPEIVKTSAPGKLGDYLSSGRPILAHVPPDCFVAWYLRKYECGAVVDKDDPAELARVMRQLLDDESFCTRLAENARKRALIDFAPGLARRRFLELING